MLLRCDAVGEVTDDRGGEVEKDEVTGWVGEVGLEVTGTGGRGAMGKGILLSLKDADRLPCCISFREGSVSFFTFGAVLELMLVACVPLPPPLLPLV